MPKVKLRPYKSIIASMLHDISAEEFDEPKIKETLEKNGKRSIKVCYLQQVMFESINYLIYFYRHQKVVERTAMPMRCALIRNLSS